MTNNNQNITSGIFWKLLERLSAQTVSFIVSLIIARKVTPDAYGIIALVIVFINLANVFVVNGISTSLVQNKNAKDIDFSTCLYCSIILAIVSYLIIFIFSDNLADFYNIPKISLVFKVLALKLILSAVNSIQHAYVQRHMLFKMFFKSTLAGTIVSGIVGIFMAMNDFGVWALVTQLLLNPAIDIIVLSIIIPWKPQLVFSLHSAQKSLKYGINIALGSFFDELYLQIRALIIGKYYNSTSLGYYQKGISFPAILITNLNSSISSVLFPAIANVNGNPSLMKKKCKSFIRMITFIVSPLLILLFITAPYVVELLLTEKWLPSVIFIKISCIMYILSPINTANNQVIKASGNSSLYLKIEIIKKVFGIIVLLLCIPLNLFHLACSAIIVQIFCNLVNIYPTKQLINYGYKEQFVDATSSIFLASLVGFMVSFFDNLNINISYKLIIQIITYMCFYFLLASILKKDEINTIKSIIQHSKPQKKI